MCVKGGTAIKQSEKKVLRANNVKALAVTLGVAMISFPLHELGFNLEYLSGLSYVVLLTFSTIYILAGFFLLVPTFRSSFLSVIAPFLLFSPALAAGIFALFLNHESWVQAIGPLYHIFFSSWFSTFFMFPLQEFDNALYAQASVIVAALLPSALLLLGLLLRKGIMHIRGHRPNVLIDEAKDEFKHEEDLFVMHAEENVSTVQAEPYEAKSEFPREKDVFVSQVEKYLPILRTKAEMADTKSMLRENNRKALIIHLVLSVAGYVLFWTPIPWLALPVLYVLAGKKLLAVTDRSHFLSVWALFLFQIATFVLFALPALPSLGSSMLLFFVLNFWASMSEFALMFVSDGSGTHMLLLAIGWLLSTLISPLLLVLGMTLSKRSQSSRAAKLASLDTRNTKSEEGR